MNPISETELRGLFVVAGIPVLKVYQLAHSYFSYQIGEDEETTLKNAVYRATRPSWLVKTPFGLIALNLRKRVVDIDWSDTPYRAVLTPRALADGETIQSSYPDSITGDDVTKSETCVHAYSLVKAAEYLTQLGSHLRRAAYDAVQFALAEPLPSDYRDGLTVARYLHDGPHYTKSDIVRAILVGAAKAALVTTPACEKQ